MLLSLSWGFLKSNLLFDYLPTSYAALPWTNKEGNEGRHEMIILRKRDFYFLDERGKETLFRGDGMIGCMSEQFEWTAKSESEVSVYRSLSSMQR